MMAAVNLNAVQTKIEFTLDSQYDTFLEDEIKLLPNAIAGVKTVGGLTKLSKWGNKTDKHFEELVDDLLKPKDYMTDPIRNKGSNGYILPKYIPGTFIYLSV